MDIQAIQFELILGAFSIFALYVGRQLYKIRKHDKEFEKYVKNRLNSLNKQNPS